MELFTDAMQVFTYCRARLLTGALFFLPFAFSSAVSAEVILGPKPAAAPEISAGELLVRELNCVSCHAVDAQTRDRLPFRPAPILGEAGQRITPQYLRKWLSSPHNTKAGTPMPDLLHSSNAEEKAARVEELTHFLISLQPTTPPPALAAEDFHLKQGESLYHSIGCVACHEPFAAPSEARGENPAQPEPTATVGLKSASVPLGDLARKTTLAEFTRFLLDPVKARPSGRMPSLALTIPEATSIATYLLREQLPNAANPGKIERVQGLRYQYFEGTFRRTEHFDNVAPVKSGRVSKFEPTPRQRDQEFGFRFTGSISIPSDGEYIFYSNSDDGSRLWIGDKLVIDNDGEHAPQEREGIIMLKAGDHPIMGTLAQMGGGWEYKVSWRGPGFDKQEIPSGVLSHIGKIMTPLGSEDFQVKPELANKGEALFASLGCASCHQVSGRKFEGQARKAFAELAPDRGCLSENPEPGIPRYDFSAEQRVAVRKTVADRAALRTALAPQEQVTHTLAALNCYACHARDGKGGMAEHRLPYFRVLGEADLGDEGRVPPHLTKVGAKLRPEWMREVLLNRGYVRPYMATRMPQFGEVNVGHLPGAFDKADSIAGALPAPEISQRDAKFGRRLVGVGGLTCISCHTFGQFKSLGIPAIDLTTMTKRLKYDWYHRYLLDPASLRPGTRMPTFWPEGKAANQDILNGNTEAQISSIWAFLSAGKEADVPPGLVQGRMEIVAESEPAIYRHFIQGAGTRAIGVGYPEKVNLAWDANEMRLAMIWQGSFIDAARHSSGRGEGFEPPLGNNVVNMPPGPMVAQLENPQTPWPKETGRKTGMHLGGYEFDQKRRPAFAYTFNQIRVEDFYEPMQGEIDAFFKRTLKISAPETASNLWFRAAAGEIEKKDSSTFLVDKKVTIRLSSPGALVRQSEGRSELLVPLRLQNGQAQVTQEIIW